MTYFNAVHVSVIMTLNLWGSRILKPIFSCVLVNGRSKGQFATGSFCYLSAALLICSIFSHRLYAQEQDTCFVFHEQQNDTPLSLTLNQIKRVPVKQFTNHLSVACHVKEQSVLIINNNAIRKASLHIEHEEQQKIAANKLVFVLPQGQYNASLVLDAERDFSLTLVRKTWPDYALAGQQHNLLLGLFYGLCITLVFYLYVMGRSLKDKRFHFYCYYVLCAGIFFLLQEGNINLFFDANLTNNIRLNLLFAGLTVFTGTIFVVTLLGLQRRWSRFTRYVVMYPAVFVLGVSIVLCFLPRGEWFTLLAIIMARTTMAVLMCTFGLIAYASYVRVHTARLVLLASLTVCCAMVFRIFLGDQSPFLQRYGLLFSFAIESFLLAIATSERIKRINQEKILAQAQAMTDPLCEIFNRRGWEEAAEKIVKNHNTQQGILCLLYIDLDYFKEINDNFGHKAGDQVLRIMAKIIRKQMRDQDAVGRLGGDEFVALAQFEDERQSEILRERVTKRLKNINISTDSAQIRVTASVGCVVFSDNEISVSEMLQKADQAMYMSKRENQDKTCS
ncbi:diguanylate cyclase [Paraglaciecola sp. T6c]|uniref:sensor domain-containing diguanylate cyclase n=1 Tax=Pseudoalteromonas atlantica (strain T6c / ATCC BAA-1087) TaxID=3042615 RepID=UPI00005C6E3A|nr:diguanylate cyclase [Paraglaciecola sp. T6c]ABG40203.1 diguanylate cyclase [Paraglaciecola sp. T6c]